MNFEQSERTLEALESIAHSLKKISAVGGDKTPGPLEMIGMQLREITDCLEGVDLNIAKAFELYEQKNAQVGYAPTAPKGFY